MNYPLMSACLLIFLSSQVVASEHTGYWKERTDNGAEFKCQAATSKSSMEGILQQAGWNMSEGVPRVNWDLDEVVIVSPSKYYKNGRMVFFGLFRRGGEVVLDYGFKSIEGSESVGANSASFGSVGEGRPATIVVAYRRGLDSGLNFKCSNRGFVQ